MRHDRQRPFGKMETKAALALGGMHTRARPPRQAGNNLSRNDIF
jgi:hypothetical protein